MGNFKTDKYSSTAYGSYRTCDTSDKQKDHAEVSDGSCTHGSRSAFYIFWTGKGMECANTFYG